MKTAAKKHITITRASRNKLEEAKARVLQVTGMTEEELFEMKLDIGLLFLKEFTRIFITGRQELYDNLSRNADWDFWNWWNMKWAFDDAALLQAQVLDKGVPYRCLKEAMIGEDLLTKDLYWLVQTKTDIC